MKLMRWRALIPLVVFLGLITFVWSLLVDRIVERGIESFGALVVGARVDLAGVDVRLIEGRVVLHGLEVTNPDAPMTNLFQADEIVADVALRPLLEKRIVVDTLAVRGLRFGMRRSESGALDGEATGNASRGIVSRWVEGLDIPPLSIEGLGSAIDVGRIDPDSLNTLRSARSTLAQVELLREEWSATLVALDPQPHIDAARALVERLRGANPLRLGVSGVANLVNTSRSTLDALGGLEGSLTALDSVTRGGVKDLRGKVSGLADARTRDYAYARGLLQLPSLEGPDLSTSIFGNAVVQWVRPLLYWVQVVDRYLPPGLDPRNRPGPKRARREGTTVEFPGAASYPRFLLTHGEIDMVIGGTGAAAGSYAASIRGLTSDPAVYGKPLELIASRAEGSEGPANVRVAGFLNHVSEPVHDSVAVALTGIGLPAMTLTPLGVRLTLEGGSTDVTFERRGDEIVAEWVWASDRVRWERLGGEAEASGDTAFGSSEWVESLLWRTVSGLTDVRIAVRLEGALTNPSLAVESNVGEAVSQALRRELGREIARAEQRIRAEVDRLVAGEAARVRSAVGGLEADMLGSVSAPLGQLREVEEELRRELRKLTRLPRIPTP